MGARYENANWRAQCSRRSIWAMRNCGIWTKLTRIMQAVLSPVFLVSLVVVPTVLVRPPSVTCADLVACSHQVCCHLHQCKFDSGTNLLQQPRSGASGTSSSPSARSDSQLPLPLPHQPALLSSSPAVTASRTSQRSHSSSPHPPSSSLRPAAPSSCSERLVQAQILPRSRSRGRCVPVRVRCEADDSASDVVLSSSTTRRLMARRLLLLSATSQVLRSAQSLRSTCSSSLQVATLVASSSGHRARSRLWTRSTAPPRRPLL